MKKKGKEKVQHRDNFIRIETTVILKIEKNTMHIILIFYLIALITHGK